MFQSEAKWEIIDMKWFFYFLANKTHFQNQGFALSLVLKVRVFGLMITGAHEQTRGNMTLFAGNKPFYLISIYWEKGSTPEIKEDGGSQSCATTGDNKSDFSPNRTWTRTVCSMNCGSNNQSWGKTSTKKLLLSNKFRVPSTFQIQ